MKALGVRALRRGTNDPCDGRRTPGRASIFLGPGRGEARFLPGPFRRSRQTQTLVGPEAVLANLQGFNP